MEKREGGGRMGMTDDSDLLARMARGDEAAFVALMNRYERGLFNRFLRVFRDREEAADLTQQAFLVLIRNPSACRPERGTVGTFLFGVARILILKRLREKRRERLDPAALAGPGADPGPLEESLRRERVERILEGIGRLPPVRRRLLLLKEQQGLATKDIARLVRLPMGTVKSHLRRARMELRRWLATTLSSGGDS
jgi:RNA polymerase sigma-70 factor, ECF subfamily